ncbi:hypothetical protein [Streptomyces sp. NRRL S-87]|uniref:hypothetical protein n=1 Tax=Streptomyces sp. NRRL S-87 TaxID=1463920 RepID=UPI00131EB641|nr:hypothetical protein [Streptomyces sp. NRRL S-87]
MDQQLVKVGEEEGRSLTGLTYLALVAGFYDCGDIRADDRQGVSLNQYTRKISRGQADDRVVSRICEQLNFDTFHLIIQPQPRPLLQA